MSQLIDSALAMGFEIKEVPFKYLHKPVTDFWGIGLVDSEEESLPRNGSDFVDVIFIPNSLNDAESENIRVYEEYLQLSEALSWIPELELVLKENL